MKNLLSIFTVLSILSSVSAFAGSEGGNGGDGVFCPSAAGTAVELLDYYEARTQRGVNVDLPSGNLSRDEALKLLLERIRTMNPSRAALYESWENSFMSEAAFVPNISLIDIPDSQHIAIPNGCEVKQLVIQRDPQFPGEKRYTVSEDLWNFMDAKNQAGMILHELVYRELKSSQTNSISTRYFNSQIAGDQFAKSDLGEYLKVARLVGFDTADVGTIHLRLKDAELYDNGRLRSAGTAGKSTYQIDGQTIPVLQTVYLHPNGLPQQLSEGFGNAKIKTTIYGAQVTLQEPFELDDRGRLVGANYAGNQTFSAHAGLTQLDFGPGGGWIGFDEFHEVNACTGCKGRFVVMGQSIDIISASWFADGKLKSGNFTNPSPVVLSTRNGTVWKIKGGYAIDATVDLDQDGFLQKAYVAEDTWALVFQGQVLIAKNQSVAFYPNGGVIRGYTAASCKLWTVDGTQITVPAHWLVDFTEDGKLK